MASERGPRRGLVVGGGVRITERVGVGGTGEVWRAVSATGMPVAVKFLRAGVDARLDRLLAREIHHTAMLSHPHVVDILDEGRIEGHRYLVLEWMAGGTLASRAAELPLEARLDAVRAVLMALAHAHGRGLLHLDVKPDNILCASVPPDWRLVDFGIARHIGGRGPRVAGTPKYMAPEQQHGRNLGPAADLYAVGATAWEMVTGASPYAAGSVEALMALHRDGAPRTWRPEAGVPDAVRAWLDGMLQVDPSCRPPSAMAALHGLEAALGGPRASAGPEPRALIAYGRPLMASRGPTVALKTLADVPVLTGREAVCEALWQRLGSVEGVEVVRLEGPPGVGRTRLGRWLAEAAAEADVADVVRSPGRLPDAVGPREGARTLLWVSDAPPEADALALLEGVGRPVLVVQSDGPPASMAHDRWMVAPVADAAIRRLLIGLLSMHEEAIETIVPLVCGSFVTLHRLLSHLAAEGRLVQDGFRCRVEGGVTVPDAWTEEGLESLDSLAPLIGSRARRQLDMLRAGPPRLRRVDLESLCALEGAPEVDGLLHILVSEGVLWAKGDRLWWTDPLLCHRYQRLAAPADVAAWGDIEAARGHPVAAARRFAMAGASHSSVRLLARRVASLGKEGQLRSMHRLEAALIPMRRRGVALPGHLHVRSVITELVRQADDGTLPRQELAAALARAEQAFGDVSLIDSGLSRARAGFVAVYDLARAEAELRAALGSPWSDPSAFVEHVGFLAAVVVARGGDPLDELHAARAELAAEGEGVRAWLDVHLAQAIIASGRPADAIGVLDVHLGDDDRDVAPAVLNLLGEALRLSGRAAEAVPMYVRSARAYLDAGQVAWASSAVNLGIGLGMAGRPADALHLLTALGRRGSVAGRPVLDTCRVAHVAACYAQAGAFLPATEALDSYASLAAGHEAVDPEQGVALQILRAALERRQGPEALHRRVVGLLEAMPRVVPDTWSVPQG